MLQSVAEQVPQLDPMPARLPDSPSALVEQAEKAERSFFAVA